MSLIRIFFCVFAILISGFAYYGGSRGWLGQSADVEKSIRAISSGRGYSGGSVK